MITVVVPGPPASKGRPRLGKGGRVYTPVDTKRVEQTIAWLCRAAMKGRPPLDGPVEVTMQFIMPNRRRIDVDNLAKLAGDAINGIAYKDDSQIVRLVAEKYVGGEPGSRITVRAVTGDDLAA